MPRNLVARQLLRLFRLVEDPSPQLGGDLDSNGFDIDMGVGDDITLAGSVGGDSVIQRNAGVLEVLAGSFGVGLTLVTGGGLVLNFGGPAAGDILYGTNVGGTIVRLPIGAAGRVLQVNPAGTAPEWGTLGVLGYAAVTASQSGITSLTDLTGLSVTVTVAAGRRVRVTGHGQITLTPSGTEDVAVVGFVREGSTTLGRWGSNFDHDIDTALGEVCEGSVILTPSAGSHTYKLSLQRTIGTGSGGVVAASDNPAFILVEDIGPA